MTSQRSLVCWQGGAIFAAFAFNYFLSALLRAVIATLAPEFARELQVGAGELGLLAGAYFLGFACMQLPVGWLLDHHGARRVLLSFLVMAVLGCLGFALARTFGQLVLARLLIGVGVSASLMAPLTAFVRLFNPLLQLRLNSWMLMSGSLGMVASTLPVQALLPWLGWRNLFFWLTAALIVAWLAIAVATPPHRATADAVAHGRGGYARIVRQPVFVRMWPLACVTYGGLIAVQSLWAGPWLTHVVRVDAVQAAGGLFVINLSMLASFMVWGLVMPRMAARGIGPELLIRRGWPLGAAVMGAIIALGPAAGTFWLAMWCVCTSVITLSQPAVSQAFPKEEAGRALSALNLLVFIGVFVCQWGIGLAIDGLMVLGWERGHAHRAAMALLLLGMIAAGAWYSAHSWSEERARLAASRG
ncbi:MAG TPA: MFS transporter [Burkholderiaceae bacterium]|nr:MFS transporter [Burkholderiaceae bacterium]